MLLILSIRFANTIGPCLCNFVKSHNKEQFEFEPVVQEEMSLKDISFLELWQPLCSKELNNLCNFGRRHHEEQFCEIILNLNQWFSCCLKIFLIWSSAALLFSGAELFVQFWLRAV